MTREKALKIAEYRDCQSLVERIYDDIESRVCENCIHSSIDYSGTLYQCHLLRMSFNNDFGCNYFKSIVESK